MDRPCLAVLGSMRRKSQQTKANETEDGDELMSLLKSALALSVAVVTLGFGAAHAQTYPDRAVEFIVPFAPGGGADASQRAFNKFAEPIVGKPLPIINKPGAGGATGWAELVRAKPDGYTLAVVTPPFSVLPAIVKPKQTGYTLDQFTNICIYAVVPDVLLVREDSPFKTFADLVAFAKANPKKVKAANTGTLGADFMTTLMIENGAGIEFTQIPFNSGALGLQGLLAGTTEVMVASSLYAVAQKGAARTLAIATEQRDPMIPDVPTFKELGFDVVSERFRAIAGPPGLPAEVVKYWEGVCKKVTENPEFKAEMDKAGQPVNFKDAAGFTAAINKMIADTRALAQKYKLIQ
jgi:tripartite-type tricarboxylate transporter receptor subunit TctC